MACQSPPEVFFLQLLFDRFKQTNEYELPFEVKLCGIVPKSMLLEMSNISRDKLPKVQWMLPSKKFGDMLQCYNTRKRCPINIPLEENVGEIANLYNKKKKKEYSKENI